jgi:transposase-like protein
MASRRHADLNRRTLNVLRRAVDGEGEVLEILVQPQRDKAAAVGLPRKP